MSDPDRKKLFCNACRRFTNHELVAARDKSEAETIPWGDGDEWPLFLEEWRFSFWICRGCESAVLEERYGFDREVDDDGSPVYSYKYHPTPETAAIRKPKKFEHIDERLNRTYVEVVAAHNAQLHIVAAVGVRALLEGICVEQGIDDKIAWGLTKKIALLQQRSSVPAGIVDGLMKLKVVGDGAAHYLRTPTGETMTILIDLLEALLTHLYEAQFDLVAKAQRAARHKTSTRPRKK